MTVAAVAPDVFDAGLPTVAYDDTETAAEVYPRFQAAQRHAPIALGPHGPEVLSYELVRAVLRDPRFKIPPGIHLLLQGISSGPLWDKVTASLLCLEGAPHQRLRSLVSKAFTPRATARLHDTIDDVVNELIDRVVDAGRCDVVTDIARPYPIPIICALLGAPRDDWQRFSVWADDVFKAFSFTYDPADEPDVMRAWG
jgi:cytochrome P450